MAFQLSMFPRGGSRAGAAADAYCSSNCSRALLAAAALGAGGATMGGVATDGSSAGQLTIGNMATTFTNTNITAITNNNNINTATSSSLLSSSSSSPATSSLAAATGTSDRVDNWALRQQQGQQQLQQQHTNRALQLSEQHQLSAAATVASHQDQIAGAQFQHFIHSDLSDLDTDTEDFDKDRQHIDELIDEFDFSNERQYSDNSGASNTSGSNLIVGGFNYTQQQSIEPSTSLTQQQQLVSIAPDLLDLSARSAMLQQKRHQMDENSLSNESILSMSDSMDTALARHDDDENHDDGDEDNSDQNTGGSGSNSDQDEAMAEQEMALNLSVHEKRDQRNVNQELLLNTFNPFIKAAASAVAAAAATSQSQQQQQQQEMVAFFASQQQQLQQHQQQKQGQLQLAAPNLNNLNIQSLIGASTSGGNSSAMEATLNQRLTEQHQLQQRQQQQQQQLQQASNRLYQHIQETLGASSNGSASGASLAAALAASQQNATVGLSCNGPTLTAHLQQQISQVTTAPLSTTSASPNNSSPLSATFAHLLQASNNQNAARHGYGHHHQASSSGSSSYHSHSSSASSTSSMFSSAAGADNRLISSCSPEQPLAGPSYLSLPQALQLPLPLPPPISCQASTSAGLTMSEPHQQQQHQASVAQLRLHQQLLNINFNDIHHNHQLNPYTTSTSYEQRSAAAAAMNQSNSQLQQQQQKRLSAHRTLFLNTHYPTHHLNHLNHLNPVTHHEIGPLPKANKRDLERIRSFIEQFKARRGALGLTQKQAAQCFRAYTNDRYAFSDNFVGHFEGFQFRPQTAMTIADSLAEWLEFAENETRQGRQLSFMPGKVKETRKRKYEVIRIRDSAKRILVDAFEQNRSPSTSELEQLSRITNIPSRNIEIFFKNRRTSRQYHQ